MSSVLTFSWATQNLAANQCVGCGRVTSGWGTKPPIRFEQFGPHKIPVYAPDSGYALCGFCGGDCCGSCAPGCCEFGIEGGGPSACEPDDGAEGRLSP